MTADRVRVYAVAADGKRLEKYKTRDLVLGTDSDRDTDGRLKYKATRMDSYTYTVSMIKSKKS